MKRSGLDFVESVAAVIEGMLGWTVGMVGFYLAFEVVGPMLP